MSTGWTSLVAHFDLLSTAFQGLFTMRHLLLGLTTALSLVLISGCSRSNPSAPSNISGTVTYKGSPVSGGSITFKSPDLGFYSSALGEDGSYQIIDMPTGPMVVTVETESINPNRKKIEYGGGKGDKQYAERMMMEKKMGAPIGQGNAKYVKIPAKYNDANTSPLNITIERGSQSKTFDLTD
jgi:hypothetical protein